MKKFLKSSIARYSILCVLAAAIGINVFALNAAHLTGNAAPMPFGVGISVVLSGSMEPALSVGDLLIVLEQEQYQTGDIVVYQSGSVPVVHRIVDISGETVVTRGDANNASDEPFPLAAVKGKVVASIPMVGHAVWTMKSPAVTVAMLIAAVLLVECSFRSGKTEKEQEKEKIKAEIRALKKELEEN